MDIKIPETSPHGEVKQTNSFVCSSKDNFIIEQIAKEQKISTSRVKRFLIRKGLLTSLGVEYERYEQLYKTSLEEVIPQESK